MKDGIRAIQRCTSKRFLTQQEREQCSQQVENVTNAILEKYIQPPTPSCLSSARLTQEREREEINEPQNGGDRNATERIVSKVPGSFVLLQKRRKLNASTETQTRKEPGDRSESCDTRAGPIQCKWIQRLLGYEIGTCIHHKLRETSEIEGVLPSRQRAGGFETGECQT